MWFKLSPTRMVLGVIRRLSDGHMLATYQLHYRDYLYSPRLP